MDHGSTGANRSRLGLREALAAVRTGDTLVVIKLDRLARSLPDARDIADELTAKGVVLSLGRSTYGPISGGRRQLFNVLGIVAEFESDPIRLRMREGRAVAKTRGRLRGKQLKLSAARRKHLYSVHDTGNYTLAELAELFNVSRTDVYPSSKAALPPPHRRGTSFHNICYPGTVPRRRRSTPPGTAPIHALDGMWLG